MHLFLKNTVRSLPEPADLTPTECRELYRANRERSRMLAYFPGVMGAAAFMAWMIFFGVTTDWLERYPAVDLIGRLQQLGPTGYVLIIVLGYGIAVVLACITAPIIRNNILERRLKTHLNEGCCLWCGYSLRGLDRGESGVCCPECGRGSPVRQ